MKHFELAEWTDFVRGSPCEAALFGFVLDGDQLHLEDERGVRPDGAARCLLSVSKLGRDEELPLGVNGHELKGFAPALDDSVDRESRRLVATVGAVELSPVDEGPPVLADDHIVSRGLVSLTRFDDLVL